MQMRERMVVGGLPEYAVHKHRPTRTHLLLAAVAAALPILGLCYLSGIVWSRSISTNAADVVAAQRLTLGKPAASGAVLLSAAGAGSSASNSSCQLVTKAILPPKTRQDIATLLQQEGFEVGAELGVQHGIVAAETLWAWRSCKRYYLVDAYSSEQHGLQSLEAIQHSLKQGQQLEDQEDIFQQAQENLQGWQPKLIWMRNSTKPAAGLIKEPLDYVYVNMHRDFCRVHEDLQSWWPLVKPGGIMAGYSFEDAAAIMQQTGQDWSRCADGVTVHQGAVQAAVYDFFEQRGLQVVVTYRERQWNSWLVRKPYDPCSNKHTQAEVAGAAQHEEPLTQLLSMMLLQEPQQQQQQQSSEPDTRPHELEQTNELSQVGTSTSGLHEPGTSSSQHKGETAAHQQGGEDIDQEHILPQQQQQHITDHQEPEERQQQLNAALLKLRQDSDSLAESRAQQPTAAAVGSGGVGHVFGDIFSEQ